MEGNKVRIWLSFDLNFKTDPTPLYKWLADNDAQDCGIAVATLTYDWDHVADLHKVVEHDLREAGLSIVDGDRIYLVAPIRDEDGTTREIGKFLFGGRQRAVWDVYTVKNAAADE